jgi:hypothetical protein
MNRYRDAMQYSAALRQIAVDHDASLRHAEQLRNLVRDATQQRAGMGNDWKQMQSEEYKAEQRRNRVARRKQYYKNDAHRTKDIAAKAKATFEEHVEALASKTEEGQYYAELQRRRLRNSERRWLAVQQHRTEMSQSGASQQRDQLMEARRKKTEHENLQKAEKMDSFAEAKRFAKAHRAQVSISKEIHRTQNRVLQLHTDLQTWQLASGGTQISPPELLISEKLNETTKRLVGLDAQMSMTRPQRPRSAMMIRPKTGGIAVYSADTPRRPADIYVDASTLGPLVSVVDARV